jgi:hypothetical protein
MMANVSLDTKLQILVKLGEITLQNVAWGKSSRNVALIKGKKYQYTVGKPINKTLEKK